MMMMMMMIMMMMLTSNPLSAVMQPAAMRGSTVRLRDLNDE